VINANSQKRQRRKPGNILAIPNATGKLYFGRELKEGVVAFYNIKSDVQIAIEKILCASILFSVAVMNHAIIRNNWTIIGWKPLEPELAKSPDFFMQDAHSGNFSIYKEGGQIVPATRKQVKGLEIAAGWEPEHIVDRLDDHFAGRKNKWLESLQPK
jgi:Immunity protein 26